MIVKLAKPFKFEDSEYTEIDLTALEDLSAGQLCKAEKQFEQSGSFSALKELNLEYCLTVAALVTKQPIEFFKALPAKEAHKVKQVVSSYFFS